MVRSGGFQQFTGTPPPTPLYVFSTNATGTFQLDPQPFFGVSSLPGTQTLRILDLDKNGLNDFIYLGYNRFPFGSLTLSQQFLQKLPGTFFAMTLPGPTLNSSHWNVSDFNGDGYPDIVVSTTKSKSVAISATYPNLSTFHFPTKAASG